jgi:hypothetical protein
MRCSAALRPWPVRTRAAVATLPVGTFAVLFAATATGDATRRLSLLPFAIVVGTALLVIPAVFALVFVRRAGPFLAYLVASMVSVPIALVSMIRSTSSTAGLNLMWVPYIASIAVLLAAVLERTLLCFASYMDKR